MENKHRIVKTAPDALKILWEEEFFQKWKKINQIEEVLATRGNHFSDAELGMALKRAKHLTRRGKRRHYEYIQKHPFVLEGEHASKKRTK